jgi:beta-lactamase superfamily II metal-dependent hydrolase
VIIAGRHRRDVTLSDRFLDAVKPRAIIASNASYPANESLSPAAKQYWQSLGIHVFDQQQTGAVTLRADASGNLHIHGFLCPEPVVLSPHHP